MVVDIFPLSFDLLVRNCSRLGKNIWIIVALRGWRFSSPALNQSKPSYSQIKTHTNCCGMKLCPCIYWKASVSQIHIEWIQAPVDHKLIKFLKWRTCWHRPLFFCSVRELMLCWNVSNKPLFILVSLSGQTGDRKTSRDDAEEGGDGWRQRRSKLTTAALTSIWLVFYRPALTGQKSDSSDCWRRTHKGDINLWNPTNWYSVELDKRSSSTITCIRFTANYSC